LGRISKSELTKLEIIRVATRMFLEYGYTTTTIKTICDELSISAGNLTFYFHSKEHLLATLVEMCCDFQWKMMKEELKSNSTPLEALCLELMAMMAICEENKRQSETLNDLTEAVALSNRASRAALGNTIKHIYYKYLPSRRLPVHEIEALHMIHTTYKEEGGNSFVDAIFNEMMNEWEHTVE